MIKIQIFGKASNQVIKTLQFSEVSEISLMDFLREKEIPVASSCYGEGVCRKCVVNKNLLSCQISLKKFLDNAMNKNSDKLQIEIDYL